MLRKMPGYNHVANVQDEASNKSLGQMQKKLSISDLNKEECQINHRPLFTPLDI